MMRRPGGRVLSAMLLPTTILGLAATACATDRNYQDPRGPRYAEGTGVPPGTASRPEPEGLRMVTFNAADAKHIERTIQLFRSIEQLEHADVIALQEMDGPGTQRIAQALAMAYVYYPATVYPHTHRDFGNAILSRWPIVADQKILLPHLGRFDRTQRIATAVTILAGNLAIRIYSFHLGTFVDVSRASKRDQVGAVLRDAAQYPRVVIAGDANNYGIGYTFLAAGCEWLTQHTPATDHFFHWDHIFTRGFGPTTGMQVGVVRNNLGASDHRPVWAFIPLRPPTQ